MNTSQNTSTAGLRRLAKKLKNPSNATEAFILFAAETELQERHGEMHTEAQEGTEANVATDLVGSILSQS